VEPFVARPAPFRIAMLAFGSLLFVLLSLWIAGKFGEPPQPGFEWLGWLGAAFFALMGVGWTLRLRERDDQIVVDEAGLTYRLYSNEHIPWSAVTGIEARSVRRQIFFAIHLDEPEAHPPSRLLGRVAAAQRRFGQGDFTIVATGTNRNAGELGDALFHFWRRTGGRG
jgi:hypothetical protein